MCKNSSLSTFHYSFLTLCLRVALVLTLVGLSLRTQAAPLVLKDDFRSPRNKDRPFRKSTRLIVLHTTEAHAKSSLNKLCERGEAHYCVTEKGEAYRIVDRDREAFHAGRSMWNGKEDCDEFSVGIEVVGYHNQAMPLKQIDALKELVDRLKKIYNIKDAQVVCHSHVAYGPPNVWHKQKHRGRKRCGMLFAMPSVRARLGLAARPAYDPDTRAGRLIQADPELENVLYGNVDTMALVYGRSRPQVAARPTAVASKPAVKSKAATSAKTPSKTTAKTSPKPTQKAAPKVVPRQVVKTIPKVPEKPVAPPPRPVVKAAPRPVVRPPLVTVEVRPGPVTVQERQEKPLPKENESPQNNAVAEEGRDWLTVLGLKGGYFKKKAKLVVPKDDPPRDGAEQSVTPKEEVPEVVEESAENVEETSEDDVTAEDSPVLPLPKDLHVAKMGDDVKNLAALAKLPGYTRGGPVNGELTPFKIAGAAWKSPTTYYYSPRGDIVTGDKVDEKSIEAGTFIFFKK